MKIHIAIIPFKTPNEGTLRKVNECGRELKKKCCKKYKKNKPCKRCPKFG